MEEPLQLSINPNFRHQMLKVGQERTQVFVIDDFLVDLAPLLKHAYSSTQFNPEQNTSYPGIRADLPTVYTELVKDFLKPLFYRVYQVPNQLNMTLKAGKFSQVSLVEDNLEEQHCLPHYDSTAPYYFAALHYINPGNFGGTSFFHHRPSGFENIHIARKTDYLDSVTHYLKSHSGNFFQQYFVGSDPQFECTGTIGYRQNRLIIYPATLLHSPAINPAKDVSSDIKIGRLTANLFIDFAE